MSMFLTVLLKMLMNIIMMTHKNGIGYKLKSVIVISYANQFKETWTSNHSILC